MVSAVVNLVRLVTLADRIDSIIMRGPTVNTAVLVLPANTTVFKNPTDLTEYEHGRSLRFHRREEFVEDDHLA